MTHDEYLRLRQAELLEAVSYDAGRRVTARHGITIPPISDLIIPIRSRHDMMRAVAQLRADVDDRDDRVRVLCSSEASTRDEEDSEGAGWSLRIAYTLIALAVVITGVGVWQLWPVLVTR